MKPLLPILCLIGTAIAPAQQAQIRWGMPLQPNIPGIEWLK